MPFRRFIFIGSIETVDNCILRVNRSVETPDDALPLYQSMFQTVIINPILRNVAAYIICHCFQTRGTVLHRHTRTDGLQHFDVIIAVPECNRFRSVKMRMLKHLPDRDSFAPTRRNNIYRTIPPRSDLGVMNAVHYGWILRFVTSHHDLIDFLLLPTN